mmetsp:Transcript_4370/g.12775  ORF Transcript_4370/g.12775 Transcript_4370/m.12775 type:complete len:476 (+) Transcript_4370:158-1585(+)
MHKKVHGAVSKPKTLRRKTKQMPRICLEKRAPPVAAASDKDGCASARVLQPGSMNREGHSQTQAHFCQPLESLCVHDLGKCLVRNSVKDKSHERPVILGSCPRRGNKGMLRDVEPLLVPRDALACAEVALHKCRGCEASAPRAELHAPHDAVLLAKKLRVDRRQLDVVIRLLRQQGLPCEAPVGLQAEAEDAALLEAVAPVLVHDVAEQVPREESTAASFHVRQVDHDLLAVLVGVHDVAHQESRRCDLPHGAVALVDNLEECLVARRRREATLCKALAFHDGQQVHVEGRRHEHVVTICHAVLVHVRGRTSVRQRHRCHAYSSLEVRGVDSEDQVILFKGPYVQILATHGCDIAARLGVCHAMRHGCLNAQVAQWQRGLILPVILLEVARQIWSDGAVDVRSLVHNGQVVGVGGHYLSLTNKLWFDVVVVVRTQCVQRPVPPAARRRSLRCDHTGDDRVLLQRLCVEAGLKKIC